MNNPRGFTLVISVLVLSTIMLMIAIAAARGLTGELAGGFAVEQEIRAQSLAEGCAESALNALREDHGYAGNETLTIGTGTCTIRPILFGATTTVETAAIVNNHPYRLRIVISNLSPFTISSWERVSVFE